jgi:hypothetical protein
MSTSGLIRGSGLAALLGGALWVVVFAIYALRASGPGAEAPYSSFEGLGIPGVLSLLLIAFGFMGLDWPTWRGEGYGRLGRGLGRVGFGLALLGVFVIVGSGASGAVGIIGVVVLMVASLLVGAAALITRVLPRWGAIVLIVGSLTFFLFDTETARAWCAVPYGVAWIALGYLQLAGRGVELQGPTRAR